MRILLDLRGSLLRSEDFSILKKICERMGFAVDIASEDISYSQYSAIVIFPKWNWVFSPKEIKELKDFVLHGGVLFVFYESNLSETSNIGELLKDFGIFPANKNLNSTVVVSKREYINRNHPVCRDINELHFIKPCPIRILKRSYIKVLIRNPDEENPLPLVVVSQYGSGKIIVIGSALMFRDDYILLGDNANFIMLLLSWALRAKRVNIKDITKVSRAISVVIPPKMVKNEEIQTAFSPVVLTNEKSYEETKIWTKEKTKEIGKAEEMRTMEISQADISTLIAKIESVRNDFKRSISELRRYVDEKFAKYDSALKEIRMLLMKVRDVGRIKEDLNSLVNKIQSNADAIYNVSQELRKTSDYLSTLITTASQSPVFSSLVEQLKTLMATMRALQNWMASISDELRQMDIVRAEQKETKQVVQESKDYIMSVIYHVQALSNQLKLVLGKISEVLNVLAHMEQLMISLIQEQTQIIRNLLEEIKKLKEKFSERDIL